MPLPPANHVIRCAHVVDTNMVGFLVAPILNKRIKLHLIRLDLAVTAEAVVYFGTTGSFSDEDSEIVFGASGSAGDYKLSAEDISYDPALYTSEKSHGIGIDVISGTIDVHSFVRYSLID